MTMHTQRRNRFGLCQILSTQLLYVGHHFEVCHVYYNVELKEIDGV